ncbi:macro domain-containing protein [Brevibacillus sp. Leaf182]|uniref:type II toxin-antitoxin system antitoxin DNA ADP-ribosyl glycohydrolase DarG n=1 Tax=Brevibacillus sp. Leaf182 TaxID=1736290 RepID=UPI0006FBD801|nr:macro domain-containing protein [Brevibacillus sp. Leaf182]RAT96980.1 Appr-1-p processing protein [Brevibacillus sp. Leaf182]
MITLKQGDLFESNADAIVNTVNCVGVMGKGVALEVKKRYPHVYSEYRKACDAGVIKPGVIQSIATENLFGPKYIINFPTKRHWKTNSIIEDIEIGLITLVDEIKKLKLQSIAIPPLGCGNGGLDWDVVKPKIINALSGLDNIDITIFEPKDKTSSSSNKIKNNSEIKPTLNKERYLLLSLLGSYTSDNYVITVNEIQKLAYLMQVQGQKLGLEFIPSKNGPFSEKLNLVLKKLQDHYLEVYSISNKKSVIRINNEYLSLEKIANIQKQIDENTASIINFIRGYRSEIGMELFSIVLWETLKMSESDGHEYLLENISKWNSTHHYIFKSSEIISLHERIKSEMSTFVNYK